MSRELHAYLAAKRFGFGVKPGELDSAPVDPRDLVLAQLERPQDALLEDPALPGRVGATLGLFKYRDDRKVLRNTPLPTGTNRSAYERMMLGPNPAWETYRIEARHRTIKAVTTNTPFLERLVSFWSNHLCIGVDNKPLVRLLAGEYERNVIRPHVLGRFEDMLVASASHPAMQDYLDNRKSIGPNSEAGRRTGNGLNENLAREILELHTVGVDGGYVQEDVTSFARILTGWAVYGKKGPKPGQFHFNPARHEPGIHVVMNKSYDQPGFEKGLAVLRDLVHKPETARFLSGKLVRHFLGEVPKGNLVDRLAAAYLSSGGNLGALTRTFIESAEVWADDPQVFTSPNEYLVATLRATGIDLKAKQILRMQSIFGQKLWDPPSPAGWPDGTNSWLAPDALLERLDWAEWVAAHADLPRNMSAFAQSILGPHYDASTRMAVERAESRRQAFALLVMSPGFQRR